MMEVTAAVIWRGDKFLICQRPREKYCGLLWEFPGGKLEPGETLEECVVREVQEEVGLTITNIRYFGSQAWPYPSGVMIGFTADYVSGELHLQEEELSQARWFNRDCLPPIPDKMSIARKLIDDYIEEKEKPTKNKNINQNKN